MKTALRAAGALLVLTVPFASSGCHLFQRRIVPRWVEARVATRSETVMYDVVHMSLHKAGYPVGIGADKAARRIVTGWYVSEAPFKGEGYRQKATVQYAPVAEDRFDVRVRVERETNESLRPLDPRYAKWEQAQDNVRDAERILQYVRSYLSDGSDFEAGSAQR